MGSDSYRILDEPSPGALARNVAVQPFWPLLGVMLGGVWLSWPWFLLNAVAIGSPTRRRETGLVALGLAGKLTLMLGLGLARTRGLVADAAMPYLILIPLLWVLGVSYRLFLIQSRTFGIYEYYGGKVNNGIIFLLGGVFLGGPLMSGLFRSMPLLRLVLG